jgi:hypothetical protein
LASFEEIQMTFRSEQPLRNFGLAAVCALAALAAITTTGKANSPAAASTAVSHPAPHVEADPAVSVFIQSGGLAPDADEVAAAP